MLRDLIVDEIVQENNRTTRVMSHPENVVYGVAKFGNLVTVRSLNNKLDNYDVRYSQVCFAKKTYAIKLAEKLNKMFGGDDYYVIKLVAEPDPLLNEFIEFYTGMSNNSENE